MMTLHQTKDVMKSGPCRSSCSMAKRWHRKCQWSYVKFYLFSHLFLIWLQRYYRFLHIFGIQNICIMSNKSMERKRRNRKALLAAGCVLGLILIADILVCVISYICGRMDVAVYAFLALFVIVPPLTWITIHNIDFSVSGFPWFIDWQYLGDLILNCFNRVDILPILP